MKLTVLGSGSQGNGYLFLPDNGTPGLIIEAGMPMKMMLKAINGDLSRIGACIVTHEHSDHARRLREYMERGIPTYMTQGTWDSLSEKIRNDAYLQHALRVLKPDPTYYGTTGAYQLISENDWVILPFKTVHDAKEPIGLLIWHAEMGQTLFVTDSKFIPNTFGPMHNIMIECNYDEQLLQQRDLPDGMKDRIRDSHMSVDTCIEALQANDLRKVNKIILLHLSAVDGDPEGFTAKVKNATNKDVLVAKSGMTVELNQKPF